MIKRKKLCLTIVCIFLLLYSIISLPKLGFLITSYATDNYKLAADEYTNSDMLLNPDGTMSNITIREFAKSVQMLEDDSYCYDIICTKKKK